MLLLLGLLAILVLGWLCLWALDVRLWLGERLALSYIIGFGIFTFAWFIFNLRGLPYALQPGAQLLVGLIMVSGSLALLRQLFFKRKQAKKTSLIQQLKTDFWLQVSPIKPIKSRWEWFFLTLIVGLSLLAFLSSIYWPVKDWDSIVLYDFRAKTFVATGFMDNGIAQGYFFGYPLLVSLAHTWVYLLGFQYPGIVHSLFYISFLMILYACLRREMSRSWALGWTAWLAVAPELFGPANMTYTNLAYTVYLVSGYLYLIRWVNQPKWQWFALSAVLVGFSTWTRSSEPFWLTIPIVLIGVAIWRKQWWTVVAYPLAIYSFIFPWTSFERRFTQAKTHLENTTTYLGLLRSPQIVTTFFDVVYYFLLNVIKPNWPLYFILIILSYLLWVCRKYAQPSYWVLLALIWLGIGLTFGGILLFSLFYEDWRSIGGSAQRMTIFFVPLIVYFVAIMTHLIWTRLELDRTVHKASSK